MRVQQCLLPYDELQALALRLDETAETVRNPSVKADIVQAARAVSDLSSLRFAISEIAAQTTDHETAVELIALTDKGGER
jgi:hypothetical protein